MALSQETYQGGELKNRRLPFGSRIERNDLMGAIAPGNDPAVFKPKALETAASMPRKGEWGKKQRKGAEFSD